MKLKWYGHASFQLLPDDGPTVITDPFTPEGVGYAPITDTADLVLISSDDDDAHCRADLISAETLTVVNALEVALGQRHARRPAKARRSRAIEAAEWDRPSGTRGARDRTACTGSKSMASKSLTWVMSEIR